VFLRGCQVIYFGVDAETARYAKIALDRMLAAI